MGNCVKLLWILILAALASHATAVQVTPSKEISELRGTVDSAEVILVERKTAPMGCRYVVNNLTDIDSLIDVLANAKLAKLAKLPVEGYDAKIIVRFSKGRSRYFAIALSRDDPNMMSHGAYLQLGSPSYTQIEAPKSLESDLRLWAEQHQKLAPKGCPAD